MIEMRMIVKVLLVSCASWFGTGQGQSDPTSLAEQAYIYLYPLVLMEVTRQSQNAIPNAITNTPVFAPVFEKKVVDPNQDTLYSIAWLNLTAEPVVLSVPDTNGTYYLMQLLSLWTDTFASPGKRTFGTGAGQFLIAGPRWHGATPTGTTLLSASTEDVWVLGRTQCNGTADYAHVNGIQAGYKIEQLSVWQQRQWKKGEFEEDSEQHQQWQHDTEHNPQWRPESQGPQSAASSSPPQVVSAMDAQTFFSTAISLMARNPAKPEDLPFLQDVFVPLGLPTDGGVLDWSGLSSTVSDALVASVPLAQASILTGSVSGGVIAGWTYPAAGVGSYGTNYALRSHLARFGLGANLMEDAIYLTAPTVNLSGQSFMLKFADSESPPVNAFWSITAYDPEGYLKYNSLHRYALHNWDPLVFGADGSLTLYIGGEQPASSPQANWLPTSTDVVTLMVRMYWPQESVLDGSWTMPPLEPMVQV